jgi:hypothetical protein
VTLLDDGGSWPAEKIQDFVEAARSLRAIFTQRLDRTQ